MFEHEHRSLKQQFRNCIHNFLSITTTSCLFPRKRSKYPHLKPILTKFAEENNVPGGYRESGEFEILYMNWDLYRKVAQADPVPGAPYSRGHGQLGAIDMGGSPAAGGVGFF